MVMLSTGNISVLPCTLMNAHFWWNDDEAPLSIRWIFGVVYRQRMEPKRTFPAACYMLKYVCSLCTWWNSLSIFSVKLFFNIWILVTMVTFNTLQVTVFFYFLGRLLIKLTNGCAPLQWTVGFVVSNLSIHCAAFVKLY